MSWARDSRLASTSASIHRDKRGMNHPLLIRPSLSLALMLEGVVSSGVTRKDNTGL